jgi:hypothetical protein
MAGPGNPLGAAIAAIRVAWPTCVVDSKGAFDPTEHGHSMHFGLKRIRLLPERCT